MNTLFVRLLDPEYKEGKSAIWVFFEHGQFHQPRMLLTEHEVEKLIDDYKAYQREKKQNLK